jgi:hypothetical protein
MRVQLNTMQNKTRTPARSVLAAALALPGLLPITSQAQVTAPNATLVQFKFLYYKDYQQSGDRMTIKSPALYLLTPIVDDWVFEIGAVYDSISGASPYYHTTLSGASGKGIQDGRTAADVTFTKYFANRTSVAVRAGTQAGIEFGPRTTGNIGVTGHSVNPTSPVIAPPGSSSSTAPRCMRWKTAQAPSRARRSRCWVLPAALASPHASSAS